MRADEAKIRALIEIASEGDVVKAVVILSELTGVMLHYCIDNEWCLSELQSRLINLIEMSPRKRMCEIMENIMKKYRKYNVDLTPLFTRLCSTERGG